MKTHHKAVIPGLLVAISVSTPAYTQEIARNVEVTDKKVLSAGIGFPDYSQPFQATIGLGAGPFPEYEGSDKYVTTAMPLLDIRKPGAYFFKGASINTNHGIASAGLTIFYFSYLEGVIPRVQIVMGPLARVYNGRDESDSDVLNGLGDIDQSAGVGGFIEVIAGAWLANFSVSPQEVGNDNEGILTTFDIEYTTSIRDGLELSTGLSTSWADDDYMQGYFGVTGAQAAQSGFSQFDSQSGIKDAGVQMKASYALSPRWSFEGQIGYWRFLNDAADSPIVKDEGSVNQVRGLLGFSYQF